MDKMWFLIVGNSESLIGSKQGPWIDSHKTVLRINHGVPSKHPDDLGTRTDILFMSSVLDKEEVASFDADKVIWGTHERGRNRAPSFYERYPEAHWTALSKSIGYCRPSAGLMAIDWAIRQGIKPTIVGFDSFERKTWYRDSCHTPHSRVQEKKRIETWLAEGLLTRKD